MITFIVAVICLALGLYAGKRRAKGAGWHAIACEFSKWIWDGMSKAWNLLSWPFRRDGDDEDQA